MRRRVYRLYRLYFCQAYTVCTDRLYLSSVKPTYSVYLCVRLDLGIYYSPNPNLPSRFTATPPPSCSPPRTRTHIVLCVVRPSPVAREAAVLAVGGTTLPRGRANYGSAARAVAAGPGTIATSSSSETSPAQRQLQLRDISRASNRTSPAQRQLQLRIARSVSPRAFSIWHNAVYRASLA